MIINDDSRVVNKLQTSLTDDARVVIYDCHMFIVQATGELCQFSLMFAGKVRAYHRVEHQKGAWDKHSSYYED
jgi:hypothetical protein